MPQIKSPKICLFLSLLFSLMMGLGCQKPNEVLSSGSGGIVGGMGGQTPPDNGSGGDEPFTWQTTWWRDCDDDGYADLRAQSIQAINDPAPPRGENDCGWTTNDPNRFRFSDCNDDDATIFPRQTDGCNGVNNDCDALVDEDAIVIANLYPDCDGDDFADAAWLERPSRMCLGPHPIFGLKEYHSQSMVEACGDIVDPRWQDCDGTEQGCDPRWTTRAPRGANIDCDDTNWEISPRAGLQDLCDGIDNNCNGTIDETESREYYLDCDGDGHRGIRTIHVCENNEGALLRNGREIDFNLLCIFSQGEPQLMEVPEDENQDLPFDCGCRKGASLIECDDTEPEINPSVIDYCGDGVDNNCDGIRSPIPTTHQWPDCDGDGFARTLISYETCNFIEGNDFFMAHIPPGETLESLTQKKQQRLVERCGANHPEARWSLNNPDPRFGRQDCDDADANRFPQIAGPAFSGFDRCDLKDNDCDGEIDEGYWGSINADLPKTQLIEAISQIEQNHGDLAYITAHRTAYADCDGDGVAPIGAPETSVCFNFDVRNYNADEELGDPIFDGRRSIPQLFGARQGLELEAIEMVCPSLPDDHVFRPGDCPEEEGEDKIRTNPQWVFNKPSRTNPTGDCDDSTYCVKAPLLSTRFFTDCDGDGFAGKAIDFHLCPQDIAELRQTRPEDFNVTVTANDGSDYELNYCYDFKNPANAENRSRWFVGSAAYGPIIGPPSPLVEGFDLPPHIRFAPQGAYRDCYDYDDRMKPVLTQDDYARVYPDSNLLSDPHALNTYRFNVEVDEAANGIRDQDNNDNVHRGNKRAAYRVISSISEEEFLPPNPIVARIAGENIAEIIGKSGDFNCDDNSRKIWACCTEAGNSSTCVPEPNANLLNRCQYSLAQGRLNGLLRCCNGSLADIQNPPQCIFVATTANVCPDFVGPFEDYYQ